MEKIKSVFTKIFNSEYEIDEVIKELLSIFGQCFRNRVFNFDVDDVLEVCNETICESLGFSQEVLTIWGSDGNSQHDKRFKYYSDPHFVRSQQPTEFAVDLIKILKALGATVKYCTAVSPQCFTERYLSLEEHFGAISNDVILTSAKDLVDCYIHLDDNPNNVLKSHAEHPVLMRKPWNYKCSGILAVNNLKEFLFLSLYIEMIKHMPRTESKSPIYVLVGPAGSGKCSYLKRLGYEIPHILSTKQCSKYEVVPIEEFVRLRDNDKLIESSVYGGNMYGIFADAFTDDEKPYALSADMAGAIALKARFPERVRIIFCQNSKEEIVRNIVSKESLTIDEKTTMLCNLEKEISNVRYAEEVVSSFEELEKV